MGVWEYGSMAKAFFFFDFLTIFQLKYSFFLFAIQERDCEFIKLQI